MSSLRNEIAVFTIFWVAAGTVNQVHAQCTVPTLRKTELITENSSVKLNQPDNMSILPDARVLITEMWTGKIKLFTPGAGLTEALSVPGVYNDYVENGILGLALSPDFATSNWVYVFYSRKLTGATTSAGDAGISPHQHVLVRYTFANGKLTNPKDILIVPRQTARHAGGGMTFDSATGDLYIGTGDDSYPLVDETKWGGRNEVSYWLNSLRTAANTNDLRGKLLRIRPLAFTDTESPTPGLNTTYSVPAGNLFSANTAKTKPEIYTMGHRNPYKYEVDPVSHFGLIGEVGPDAETDVSNRGLRGHDEFNLVTEPGNYGWPFAIADNQAYTATTNEPYAVGTKFTLSALKNLSKFNTGLEDLPPAKPAAAWYNAGGTQTGLSKEFGGSAETAIAGPYYRYKADLVSDVKLPAFFHGKFIVSDWSRSKIWVLEFNSQNLVSKITAVYSEAVKLIDLEIGPKGELYVLEFSAAGGYPGPTNSGALYKLEYTGTQYAASTCSQYVFPAPGTGIANDPATRARLAGSKLINLAVLRQVAAPGGTSRGVLFDLTGTKVWESTVENGVLHLPAASGNGLRLLRFE